MSTKIIIPFRDRGIDPRRAANLEVVTAWWYGHGLEATVVDDGLSGDAQFNRHRAYNRAIERFPETEVFVFTEADMLIHPHQILTGIAMALRSPGLVVPFTQYRYWSDAVTTTMRDYFYDEPTEATAQLWGRSVADPDSIFLGWPAESTMEGGKSIGAVNIVSRETLRLTGGFTEQTSGNWFDDNIIEEGFRFLTGCNTRWVDGPAVHLYHLPGHSGEHLTPADMAATERNRRILYHMRRAIRYGDKPTVRELMKVRVTP